MVNLILQGIHEKEDAFNAFVGYLLGQFYGFAFPEHIKDRYILKEAPVKEKVHIGIHVEGENFAIDGNIP